MARRGVLLTEKELDAAVRARCIELYTETWGTPGPELSALNYRGEIEAYEAGRPIENDAAEIWRRVKQLGARIDDFANRHPEAKRLGGMRASQLLNLRPALHAIMGDAVSMGVVSFHVKAPSRSSFLRDRIDPFLAVKNVAHAFDLPPRTCAVLTLLAGFKPRSGGATVGAVLKNETEEVRKALASLQELHGVRPRRRLAAKGPRQRG